MKVPHHLLLLLLFAACGGRGCPADPGGSCIPGQSDCRGDYYCSVGGICTKVCAAGVECKAACDDDEDCGGETDSASPIWRCTAGACECSGADCPEATSCIEGHCQRACALGGTCPPNDPYAPRS